MHTILSVILVIVPVLLIILVASWLVIPILAGLPWRPTSPERIRKALHMAQVLPGEHVYDLGSGDGRVLLVAASEFGALATGIEISWLHCLLSRWLAWANRISDQVK